MTDICSVQSKGTAQSRGASRSGSARRPLLAIALAGLILATGACSQDLPLNTLDPEGPAARSIDGLLNLVMVIAGIVFLFVNGAVVFMAVKFRRKKGEEDFFPVQIHGNTKLEWTWTALPAVILAVVAVFTTVTLFDIYTAKADEAAMTVQVEGQQWWWSYTYDTNGDGKFDDEDTVRTATELVIPAGETIALKITSNDVIHSFWIPKLNGKKDAVPGRVHDWWLAADKPGYFLGQCTEFCGLSHAYMRMAVRALPQDEFDQWMIDQATPAAIPEDESAREGMGVFAQQCANCHVINGLNAPGCSAVEAGSPTHDPASECYPGLAEGLTRAAQVSGNAPDLTHFMSRQRFIGGIEQLYNENGEPNRNTIEAWIRNPEDFKPSAPDPTEFSEFGRGMPKLPLTEEQIDQVVDYLLTLE